MHRLQSMLDEIEKLDRLGPRTTGPCPCPCPPQEFMSVEAILASMEMELDDLDPEKELSPERRLIRRHLEQLIKVASATETRMRDLQDEVKEKSEIINLLQETVSNMREKKAKQKISTKQSTSPAQSSSPRKNIKALPAAKSHESSRCNGLVEVQVLDSCMQSLADKVLDGTRQKGISKEDQICLIQPETGPWRRVADKSPGIWNRETIEKLEEHVKLKKEVEILRRKLEEYKQVLATSEYQRGSAQATIQHLTEEVRRCREALSVLEDKKDRFGKKKVKPSLPRTMGSKKKQLAQLVIKVCKCDNLKTAA